ncbi:hypothetical protein EZJ43_14475 [Pedobacter changchengzhani]|uniref:Glycosyl transferase n=1 Tax=Pedobacter changchengzhani TaxID=2529274 RepID=A0A4R5MI84_9SPHI|nr:hypothetical protein [Pedobacter changchengzhani]TDG35297.1 hypothetical protein EZJ43_14475 [Pedobacter changchengzhani]
MDSDTSNLTLKKSFFTFASGKKYLALAFALARSYRFHNGTSIPFSIISNKDFSLPWDLTWVNKTIVSQNILGPGLEFKLHLLDIAPTDESIFIDADSLIYGSISNLFSLFNKQTVNVIGLKVTDGIFVDEDVESACKEFDLNYMVRYCGAFYYLIKNKIGKDIFDYANELYLSGRKFQHNENTMYDEPILSIALSKFRVDPLADDGKIWGDLAQWEYKNQLNIFKFPPVFNNIANATNYKFWLPIGEYSPKILHVGSGNYNKKPWLFDSVRLKLHYKLLLPVNLSDWLVKIIVIPLYQLARKLLR